MALYTDNELIEKIKAIDTSLESAVSKSSIDTSQTKNEISISVRTLREQREYYKGLLQAQNAVLYRSLFGSSVLKLEGHHAG